MWQSPPAPLTHPLLYLLIDWGCVGGWRVNFPTLTTPWKAFGLSLASRSTEAFIYLLSSSCHATPAHHVRVCVCECVHHLLSHWWFMSAHRECWWNAANFFDLTQMYHSLLLPASSTSSHFRSALWFPFIQFCSTCWSAALLLFALARLDWAPPTWLHSTLSGSSSSSNYYYRVHSGVCAMLFSTWACRLQKQYGLPGQAWQTIDNFGYISRKENSQTNKIMG